MNTMSILSSSLRFSKLLFTALSFLALNGTLFAQIVTFDDFSTGLIGGQKGWVSTVVDPSSFGRVYVEPPQGSGNASLVAGTLGVTRNDYGTTYHLYDATFAPNRPFTDDGKITLQFDFSLGSPAFGGFGFGIPEYVVVGLYTPDGEFFGGGYESYPFPHIPFDGFVFNRNPFDHQVSNNESNTLVLDRNTWYTLRYEYDYNTPSAAAAGGTLSALYQAKGSSTWLPVPGLNNLVFGYGISGQFTYAHEISELYISFGANSQIDNINITSGDGPTQPPQPPITAVPESATTAIFAVLGLALAIALKKWNAREDKSDL